MTSFRLSEHKEVSRWFQIGVAQIDQHCRFSRITWALYICKSTRMLITTCRRAGRDSCRPWHRFWEPNYSSQLETAFEDKSVRKGCFSVDGYDQQQCFFKLYSPGLIGRFSAGWWIWLRPLSLCFVSCSSLYGFMTSITKAADTSTHRISINRTLR